MAEVNVLWVGQYQRGNIDTHYHKHEFYQMVLPLSGSLCVNEESVIRHREVMLTKPGQFHSFTCHEPGGICNLFDCKFAVTDPELHAELMNMPHCFPITADALIHSLVQTILTEAKNKDPFYQKSIDYHFATILVVIARQFASPAAAPTVLSELRETEKTPFKGIDAKKLRTYIDANLDTISTLDDITAYVHINKSTLIDAFKFIFGMTPMRYVNHRRMEIAKDMLLNTQLSVSEISERVGFQSIFYFSKAFKDKEGISPMAFRDQTKNNYFLLPHSSEFDMTSVTSYKEKSEPSGNAE